MKHLSLKRLAAATLALVLTATALPAIPARAAAPEGSAKPLGGKIAPEIIEISEAEAAKLSAAGASADTVYAEVSKESADYWKKFGTDYYYNQLSAPERAMWDDLENGCIAVLEGTENVEYIQGTSTDSSYFANYTQDDWYRLWLLFTYSNPQYYFTGGQFGMSSTSLYLVVYDEFIDGADRAAATASFKSVVDSWVGQISAKSRPEEKEKVAYDLLCNNVEYDYPGIDTNAMNQSAYSTFVQKVTVCAGYSKAFTLLMNAVGVEAAPNTSDAHAWNIIKLHGYWYEVDATWGDNTAAEIYPEYSNGDYIDFDYYNTNVAYIQGSGDQGGAHIPETALDGLLPERPYDSLRGERWNNYRSAYFTTGDGVYFIVDDVDAMLAVLIEKTGSTVPSTAAGTDGTYTVVGEAAQDPSDVDDPTQDPSNTTEDERRAKVEAFVSRMYTCILSRAVEADGLAFWSDLILSGTMTAADCAKFFVLESPEFLNAKLDNDRFLDRLYPAFFGEGRTRAVDADGYAFWKLMLERGYSRKWVLAGFVGSQEFSDICAQYNIPRGEIALTAADNETSDLNLYVDRAKVEAYVTRLYTQILHRSAEADGVTFWSDAIEAHQVTAYEVATLGFFKAPEYLNADKSIDEFLTDCYHALMDREPDASGIAFWKENMSKGMTREQVVQGFGNSPEFTGILQSYGLIRK
ncbi:MAG: DUF4214 domain-containing protein [Lachnospiraceae bacterium]|nr:DUF4214 domain-containing protein [Lachnospiraceae bacterium]